MRRMGQVALGFRSLFIRLAAFVVMAALLAWALGGTLFPRAEVADGQAFVWRGATWQLRLALGGESRGIARWSLVRSVNDEKPKEWPLAGHDHWVEAAGPLAVEDRLYVGFRNRGAREWTLAAIADNGFEVTSWPDRLEVERQLARLRSGLPMQTPAEAFLDRPQVLGAPSAPASDLQ